MHALAQPQKDFQRYFLEGLIFLEFGTILLLAHWLRGWMDGWLAEYVVVVCVDRSGLCVRTYAYKLVGCVPTS